MPEMASINGCCRPIEEATTSIDDRGYQFGDAVYEYIAAYNGKLFCLEEHLERLRRSMAGLQFPPPDMDNLRKNLLELYEKSNLLRAGIYIQISRGIAPRNHAWTTNLKPQVVMTVRQVVEIPSHIRDGGAKVITVPDVRWQHCDLKTTQLLPNVMAKSQAQAQGVFDAIFVSAEGIVREGTSSNLFMVQSDGAADKLLTHPLTCNILAGITRQVIIEEAQKAGLIVEEAFFDRQRLYAAHEAFLTGTVTEVLPLVNIDGHLIGGGRVGKVTQKLYQTLRRRMGA